MPRQVTLNSTIDGVTLPNGVRYSPGSVVFLSDEEYSLLSSSFKSAFLVADVAVASGDGGTTTASPANTRIEDGISTNLATVAQFHNADNQALPNTAFGLLTGGVAQLLNAAGAIDRQRETGIDGIPAQGVVTGTSQIASAFSTTATTVLTPGSRTVTPVAMSGTNRGVAWSIQAGSVLTIDVGLPKENVVVTAVTANTFTAVFSQPHGPASYTISGFVYNQSRDSTLTDGSAPGGVPAGTAYFWNQQLNSGTGGLEIERSAAGEMYLPPGAGGAIAFEFEDIGLNGPSTWGAGGGLAQGDRAKSVQAKGLSSLAVSSANTGQATVTLSSTAPSWLVMGAHVRLTNSTTAADANAEDFAVASVSGTTVTLGNNIANSGHTLLVADTFIANGPGTAGFTAHGMGIEEEALWDPVSGLFYIERAATQDGVPQQNVVMENPGLWNGASIDRQRGNIDTGLLINASGATTTQTTADQVNYNGRGVKVVLVTTVIGTGSITLSIQGKDTGSATYYTILSGAAVVSNTTNIYTVYPSLPATTNISANDLLPRTWRIQVVANNANAATYSVGASVIV